MSGRSTTVRVILGLCVGALALGAGTSAAGGTTSSSPGSAGDSVVRRAGAVPAGKAGPALTLQDQVQIQGYDVAVDGDGRTYIGWIASTGSAADRTVHLCVIEPGTFTCAGGVQSTSSLSPSSAAGLHVLISNAGEVTLVWFHDTVQSIDGPYNAKLATSTVQPDHTLGPSTDRAPAPSFGTLLDAEVNSPGEIIAVTGRTVSTPGGTHTELQIHPGLGATPTTVQAPVLVGKARLAFDGNRGFLVIDSYGSISEPLRVSPLTGALPANPFDKVPHTWSVGGAFDVSPALPRAPRLVAPIDNSHYFPRFASWQGTEFSSFALTGDKSPCQPTSHDLFPDVSGRLADTSVECDKVRISNQPTAGRAATVRFKISDTAAGPEPQIGTTPRGTGWVVWGQLSTGGNALMAAPVRLPALLHGNRASDEAGHVTVVGPVNCMPPVDATPSVKTDPAAGWSLVSKQLLLDGEPLKGNLHGAGLEPGSSHTLVADATFARSGDRRTVRAVAYFGACASPSAF